MRGFARLLLVIPALVLLASGCATSVVNSHPLLEPVPDTNSAKVYFIRPFTYRERGAADNPVKIDINGAQILELGKGEYALLHLKPASVTVATRNRTHFTNKDELIEMTRKLELDFKPGQTYFLHIRQVNEEFRGVYYVIQPVDLQTAKGLVIDLRAAGSATRAAPVDKLPDN